MTRIQNVFLDILCAAMHGQQFSMECSDDELQELLAIAVQQNLLPVILETIQGACSSIHNRPELSAYKQLAIQQVTQQAGQTLEFHALYRHLRSAGLHPIVIKGTLCSRLYPLEYHRISLDNDLYITKTEFLDCHHALLSYGLHTETPDERLAYEDEVTYQNENGLYIELHCSLFDTSADAPDDLNKFFKTVFNHTQEADRLLTMRPHEHLLYLLLHAFKHFIYSGVGIRQTCDIALYAQAYAEHIEWERLFKECKLVHADLFSAAQFQIAEKYLGFMMSLPECWPNSGLDIEPMLKDMFMGGIFGADSLTRLHTSTITLNAIRKNRAGEKSGILRSIFPTRNYMSRRYPFVREAPLLLPVAWLSRIKDYIIEISHNDSSASGSLRLAKERIKLLKHYGVIE